MNERRDAETVSRERIWKLVSVISAMLGAMIAKRLIRLTYTAVRGEAAASAFDPTSERFTVSNALFWAIAGGIGLVIAKIISGRVAAIGWKAATGTEPPSRAKQSAAG